MKFRCSLFLVLVVLVAGCAKNLEEVEKETALIADDIQQSILINCCSICTHPVIGQDPNTSDAVMPCDEVISQIDRDSPFNYRSAETLDQCIGLFRQNKQTVATCESLQ